MTDSIDLDEIEIGSDDEEQTENANHGDWFWRGEGDPADEPESQWRDVSSPTRDDAGSEDGDSSEEGADADANGDGDAEPAEAGDEPTAADSDGERSTDRSAMPKVPGGPTGPVGVPEERGGAGGGSPSQQGSRKTADASARPTDHGEATEPDDMTLVFTYEAINRLADPQHVVGDARGWADWVGIVGSVSTPAIRKFQRDAGIDIDFFGGSETGPAERLADVTTDSMFDAERMVLVGVGDDEAIAESVDWEFIPLETAAEKADWGVEFER